MLASRDSWPFYLPADNPNRNPFPIESISRKPYKRSGLCNGSSDCRFCCFHQRPRPAALGLRVHPRLLGLKTLSFNLGHADKGGRLSRSCGCYPLIHDQVERPRECRACEEVEERKGK